LLILYGSLFAYFGEARIPVPELFDKLIDLAIKTKKTAFFLHQAADKYKDGFNC
jgi:hypothetical protein